MDFNKEAREYMCKYLCAAMECFLKGTTDALKEAKKIWRDGQQAFFSEHATKQIQEMYWLIDANWDIAMRKSAGKEKREKAPLLARHLSEMEGLVKAL